MVVDARPLLGLEQREEASVLGDPSDQVDVGLDRGRRRDGDRLHGVGETRVNLETQWAAYEGDDLIPVHCDAWSCESKVLGLSSDRAASSASTGTWKARWNAISCSVWWKSWSARTKPSFCRKAPCPCSLSSG